MPAKRKATAVPITERIGFKTAVGIAAAAGTCMGVIIAFPKAYEVAEPYTPASSGYVRSYTDKTTSAKLSPFEKKIDEYEAWKAIQSYEMARVLLNQQQQYLFAAKKELEAAPNSVVLRDRVTELDAEVERTKKRIENYAAAPAGKRELSKP